MTKPLFQVLSLLFLGVVLFFVRLGGHDLWPPDEPRYAQVAREMMQQGDYLVPRVNGEPYIEKPPLLFWAIAAVSWPFGDVTEFSARIPSVLSALATLLLVYLLAHRLYGPRQAFWSALILATCQRFWWQARCGQIDMLLTACLTLGLYVFWRWYEDRRARWLVLFYLAAAAALYAKGPGTMVFPVLFLLAFYWNARDDLWETRWVVGFAAAGLLFVVWAVAARIAAAPETGAAAESLVATNLLRQTVGRFFLGVSHAQAPWYYLTTLPVDWIPWTLFLPWTLVWFWKKRESGPKIRLLLCWIVPAFLFFSIAVGKRQIYLLPLFPALSILIARSVVDLVDSDRVRWRRGIGIAWGLCLILLGIAPFGLFASPYAGVWTFGLLAITAAGCAFGIHVLVRAASSGMRRLPLMVAGQAAVIAVLVAFVVFPIVDQFKSARSFCAPVRELARAGAEFNLYSLGFFREEYVFYSQHRLKMLLPEAIDEDAPGYNVIKEHGKTLRRLDQRLVKALDEVHIQSLDAVSDSECRALAAALEKGLREENLEPALRTQLDGIFDGVFSQRFRVTLDSPASSFYFIQARDWRRVLAFHPDARRASVLGNEGVGSRHVLLIANPAGEALLHAM